MRKLKIRNIIYRDSILLITTINNQHLGFLINGKKSVLEQTLTLEFFWITIYSVTMTLGLPKEKVETQSQCQKILGKLILTFTTITVLPAPHEIRHLWSQQIQELIQHKSFEGEVRLPCMVKEELLWLKEILFPQQ